MKKIALIGEYNPDFEAQASTGASIEHSCRHLGVQLDYVWLSTADITLEKLAQFDGLWIAPGSPYKNMLNTLCAIQYARENDVPLLGTCGGFQHIVLEIALNLLGYTQIAQEGFDPYANDLFISALSCHLVGREMQLSFVEGSQVASYYGTTSATEKYYCTFGVNPAYIDELKKAPINIVGSDAEGEVRVIELPQNRFFVATLFVPQMQSSVNKPHPLITKYIETVLEL